MYDVRACPCVCACVVVVATAAVIEVAVVMVGVVVGVVEAVAAAAWAVGDDSIGVHGLPVVRAGPHDPPPNQSPLGTLKCAYYRLSRVRHTTRLA